MGATASKQVQFFANDWNKTMDRYRLTVVPTYCGDTLLEVRINLNTARYSTGDFQWHKLLAEGERALPVYASLENERTDFQKGMLNLRVNSAVSRYNEEAIADWLVWLTAEFLPTIEKR